MRFLPRTVSPSSAPRFLERLFTGGISFPFHRDIYHSPLLCWSHILIITGIPDFLYSLFPFFLSVVKRSIAPHVILMVDMRREASVTINFFFSSESFFPHKGSRLSPPSVQYLSPLLPKSLYGTAGRIFQPST